MDEGAQRQERESRDGYVRVRLHVLSEAEGGRKAPLHEGYRACWDIGVPYEGQQAFWDAPLSIEATDRIGGGEEGYVRLHPLHPEAWTQVAVGQQVTMHEGSRKVGVGTVVEHVPPRPG